MRKSYLIVKMSSLGDVIQSYYAAAYLKEKDSESFIAWVIEDRYKDLVRSFPCVDKVFSIDTKAIRKGFLKNARTIFSFIKDLRRERFDVIFDLQGNTKSAFATLLAKSKVKVGYSKSCVSEWPNLCVTSYKVTIDQSREISFQYLSVIKKYFQDTSEYYPFSKAFKIDDNQARIIECFIQQKTLQHRPLIMVCPHSNWNNKKLPQDMMIEFLNSLEKTFNPSFIFIYGTKKEKEECEQVYKKAFETRSAVIGALELPVWHFLMSKTSCVISMDSSALHLAGLAQIPTFSFFGPSSSVTYRPLGKFHKTVQGECPYNEKFIKRCRYLRTCKKAPCISNFKLDKLMEDFLEFYENINQDQADLLVNQNRYGTQLKK